MIAYNLWNPRMNTIRVKDLESGSIQIEVPTWVHWMATDESGSLWFYQCKPIVLSEHNAWAESKGNSQFAAYIRPPKDYKQELYTWS